MIFLSREPLSACVVLSMPWDNIRRGDLSPGEARTKQATHKQECEDLPCTEVFPVSEARALLMP